jgi:hypothetical protein
MVLGIKFGIDLQNASCMDASEGKKVALRNKRDEE